MTEQENPAEEKEKIMKIFTNAVNEVQVITKNETPYDVDGNRGITYRLIVMSGNDVEKIKVVDKNAYDLFEIGQKYFLSGEVDIRNGRSSEWKVNGFVNRK